ncbi:hypothetical protein ABBQ32_008207 [Trebouxia sp. C0010 RCD-2024]
MAANASSFGISIGLDALICVIILLFFGFFRRTAWTEKFYEPKSLVKSQNAPRKLPRSFAGWIMPTYSFTEAELVRFAGTDAAMYLRVQHFGWQLFLFCTLWCCIILIPVHVATGTYVNQQIAAGSDTFSSLDKTSISNLQSKSKAMYADWISVWAISLFLYWQLWRYNTHAVEMRIDYLNSMTGAGTEAQTVMVNDIPEVNKGIMSKLAGAVSGVGDSKKSSRQNSRTGRSAGTELEHFEDAKTGMIHPSDSSDGSYQGPDTLAEPLAAHTTGYAGLLADHQPNQHQQEKPMASNQDPTPSNGAANYHTPRGGFSANPKARAMLDSGLTEEAMVNQEFEELYPSKVQRTQMAYNSQGLNKVYNDFEKTKGKLETVLDTYQMKMELHKKLKKRTMVRVTGAQYGKWGREKYGLKPQKVDALEFYPDRLQELWRNIQEEQGAAKSKALPTAFVTFKDTFTTTVAATSMMHHDLRHWSTRAAPSPRDVLWSNVGFSSATYLGAAVLAWTLFALLAIFYLIPVGAVQALLQVDKLEKYKFFRVIMDVKILSSLITAVLPGIVLTIFLALLPALLSLLNKKVQKMVSETDVEFGVVRKYFAFQVITTFLGSLLVGSFLNQITAFLDNPKGIVNTLGSSAPQTATFFMTYILIQAFIKSPLQLLRLPGLIIFWLKYRFATTPRQKAAVWQDTRLKYGTNVANDTIIMLIGLVYCVIQPIIAPLALIYFGIGVLIWKYQVVYVYVPLVESGGKLWMQIFQHIITAMLFFQIIMIALFGIKKAPGPAVLTAPLPFITLAFLLYNLNLFNRPQVLISNRTAADIDKRQKQGGEQAEPMLQASQVASPAEEAGYVNPDARQHPFRYIPPGFLIESSELEEVVAEAQRVSPQVDAYLADNGHSNGKSNSKKQNKPISRSNDLEAQ